MNSCQNCCDSPSLQGIFCSRRVVTAMAITGLALLIVGALALLGIHYPTNPFGVIGSTLTQPGAYGFFGAGIALLTVATVAAFCCNKPSSSFHDEGNEEEWDEQTDGRKPIIITTKPEGGYTVHNRNGELAGETDGSTPVILSLQDSIYDPSLHVEE